MKPLAHAIVVLLLAVFGPIGCLGAETSAAPDAKDPRLVLWLDASKADTLTVDADGRVSAWASRAQATACRLTASGEGRPRLVSDGLNHRPAIRFDGADDALQGALAGQTLRQGTLFLVVRPFSNVGNNRYHAFFTSNQAGKNDFETGLVVDLGNRAGAQCDTLNVEGAPARGVTNLRTSAVPFKTGQIFALACNDLRIQLLINGLEEDCREVYGPAASLDEIRLGARCYDPKFRPAARPEATGFLDGEISEVLLYREDLPADERGKWAAYLLDKYGAAIPKPVRPTLDEAFAALPSLDWDQSRAVLGPIDEAIVAARGQVDQQRELERRLLAVLEAKPSRPAVEFVLRRLARIGSEACVPVVAPYLADAERSQFARLVLEKTPGEAAAMALREAMAKTEGQLRCGILFSLGTLRDRQAVPAMTALLTDPDPDVAVTAAVALGRIGAVESVDPLLAFQSGAADPVREAAVEACLDLGFRLLEQNAPRAAEKVFSALESIPRPAVRAAVLRGRIVAEPDQAAARLLSAMTDPSPRIRGVAIQCIQDLPGEETIRLVETGYAGLPPAGKATLLEAVKNRPSPAVRQAAREALGSERASLRLAGLRALKASGTAAEVPTLLARIAAARDPDERDAGRATLRGLADPGTDAAIAAQVDAASDEAVRVTAIGSLVARNAVSTVPALLKAALAENDVVRREAIVALRALADEKTAPELVRLLATAPASDVAVLEDAVVSSCRRIADPAEQAAPVLAAWAGADPAARERLLPVLGRLGGAKSMDAVREAIASTQSALRDAGVKALANWPEPSVVDALLAIARKPANETQRSLAVRGLARLLPRPGGPPPRETFLRMKETWELATREADRRLVLARMASVRALETLEFALATIDDAALRAQAIATAAKLAEGMKERHPKEARAAMEKVLAVTDDPPLRARMKRLLRNMDRLGM